MLTLGPNALRYTILRITQFQGIPGLQATSVSLNSAISSSERKPLASVSWQQPLQLFGGFSDVTLRRDVISYGAILSASTALSAPWPVAVELNQMRMHSLEGNLVSTNGLVAAVRCWVVVSDIFQTCFFFFLFWDFS